MSNSKKIFLIVALLAVVTISIHAAEPEPDTYKKYLQIGCTNIPDCLEKLFRGIVQLAIPTGTVFIIIAGFLFVTAGGDPGKLQTAKSTLVWTLIGLAVAIGAWTLAVAFKTFFETL